MYKKNGRLTYRSNRRQGYKKNNNFSNGRSRHKGSIIQQYQKYLKLAKEASSTGDRIQTEYYYQFTDHYSRLMIDLEIPFLDEDNKEVLKTESDTSDTSHASEVSKDDKTEKDENKENTLSSSDEENDLHGSIESVSFISEPTKKKSIKQKKDTA